MSTLTSPRFSFEPPPTGTEALHRVRAAWISDLHLGTRTSNTESVLQFLRDYDCEKLYVVGDLIDIWQLRRGRYWPQQHNDVIQKILRKARKGVPVVYIPGNHDEFVSTFAGAYGNISIQEHAIHVTADGRRILVIHGHELRAPEIWTRLLVAQRLREEASEGRGQFHRRIREGSSSLRREVPGGC